LKKILARLFPLALLMIVIGACGSQNPDLAPTPAPPDVDAVRASETPVPPVAATTPRITRQVGTATPLMPTLTLVPTTGAATRRAIDATPIPLLRQFRRLHDSSTFSLRASWSALGLRMMCSWSIIWPTSQTPTMDFKSSMSQVLPHTCYWVA